MNQMIRKSHNRSDFHCDICQAPVSRSQYRQHGSCSRVDCRFELRRRKKKEKADLENAWKERMQHRNQTALAVAQSATNQQVSLDQLVIVPAAEIQTPACTNVAEKRKRRFRDSLMTQITDLPSVHKDSPDAVDPDEPDPDPVKMTGCATCQGACCFNGGDEAYVTSATLRKFMNANPHLRPREVMQAYMDHIPNRSIVDSCIFHTQTGCALPRTMRSTVCNQFLCGLLKMVDTRELPKDQPVHVVALNKDDQPVRTGVTKDQC